jgi:tRNA(Ile)-lysidine synthase
MKAIKNFIEKYYKKDEPIILACSAGPDSMFLLYQILKTKYKKNLIVCYFNHKTRPETEDEEQFLENLCKKEKITFETAFCDFEKIKKLYPSKSFEELAREKRYQFFDAICNIYKTNKVITAHHLDDKIETFMFNLLR